MIDHPTLGTGEPATLPVRFDRLSHLSTFLEMGAFVGTLLTPMLGPVNVEQAPVPAKAPPGSHAAHVLLSLVADESELRVSLIIEEACLAEISTHVCGEPVLPCETFDFIGELTNIVCGNVKGAALQEGIAVTTSLPLRDVCATQGPIAERFWWIHRSGTDTRLGLLATVARRGHLRVTADQLREGMVIAQEIRDDAGALVMDAGTLLTSTGAERVPRAVGDGREVEVTVAK